MNKIQIKKSRINLLKLLFFFLILSSNILHLQAFTFHMYSGRGSKVVVLVINKNGQIINRTNLFQNNLNKKFFFLSSRVAEEFCEIPFADRVTIDEKKFKSYEC